MTGGMDKISLIGRKDLASKPYDLLDKLKSMSESKESLNNLYSEEERNDFVGYLLNEIRRITSPLSNHFDISSDNGFDAFSIAVVLGGEVTENNFDLLFSSEHFEPYANMFYLDLNEMPLYINSDKLVMSAIASWRLNKGH